MSFFTSCWLLPQKEQYSSLSPGLFSLTISQPFLKLSERTGLITFFQHLIDQSVFNRIGGTEKIISIGVVLYGFNGLPGVMREHLIELLFQIQNLTRVYLDIRSMPAEAS